MKILFLLIAMIGGGLSALAQPTYYIYSFTSSDVSDTYYNGSILGVQLYDGNPVDYSTSLWEGGQLEFAGGVTSFDVTSIYANGFIGSASMQFPGPDEFVFTGGIDSGSLDLTFAGESPIILPGTWTLTSTDGPSLPIGSVPEPGTMLLLLVGVGIFAIYRFPARLQSPRAEGPRHQSMPHAS